MSTSSSSSNDDFKKWPADVLKLYGELPLPSLYDFILANEKLSVEVRRQGKDLHKMIGAIVSLREEIKTFDRHLQMPVIGAEEEDKPELSLQEDFSSTEKVLGNEKSSALAQEGFYPAWEVDMMRQASKIEERQWEEIYIAMLEVMHQTLDENETTYNNLGEILKKSELNPATDAAVEQVLERHRSKLQSIRDQMRAHLKDIDLEPIVPIVGELYNEDVHRVVESIPAIKHGKQKKHTIARIIRIGYRRRSELVRHADVCVYT